MAAAGRAVVRGPAGTDRAELLSVPAGCAWLRRRAPAGADRFSRTAGAVARAAGTAARGGYGRPAHRAQSGRRPLVRPDPDGQRRGRQPGGARTATAWRERPRRSIRLA